MVVVDRTINKNNKKCQSEVIKNSHFSNKNIFSLEVFRIKLMDRAAVVGFRYLRKYVSTLEGRRIFLMIFVRDFLVLLGKLLMIRMEMNHADDLMHRLR
jgi:hypothetical protein